MIDKILIRADANSTIGSGHVMRCLSIAKAFDTAGKECIFVTADHSSDVLIEQAGIKHFCLDTVWNDLDTEIDEFTAFIKEYSPEIVLIDSYFVTQKYLKAISDLSYTVYIDDMNSECWPVDVIVNYNIFASVFDYSWYDNTNTKLLLGPKYAPLRSEFHNAPKHIIKENVTDILISAGGADPQNISEKIMREICNKPEWQNIKFHFVIGALNPRIEEIKRLQTNMDNVTLHINEKHMSKLMYECDIAVSAAGTTLYELCACGIPTITYTLANNQIVAAEEFSTKEVMLSVGDCRYVEYYMVLLEKKLKELIANVNIRNIMSSKMQNLVDGNGSSNFIKDIVNI